jgi:phage shock protein PspC (stress-responsive transcriptional regulator)/FtsH-binding integral membrane protein
MTTTDTLGGYSSTPPPPPTQRLLRRSRTGRVGAGVASGLGEYFGLDPVLFRVLFATSAFFGGAGILAYLIAWAAIPEAGTERAPIDGWVGALRRRRIPVWVAAVVAGVILWAVAFSWWAPGPFFPVIAVVVLLVVFFGRRDMQASSTAPPVSLTKDEAARDTDPANPQAAPTWAQETRAWISESRAAQRERRRRAMPVRIAALVTLIVTLIVLGIVDSVTGIQFQVYFWTSLAIVVAGLLVGLVSRRTPWSIAILIVPSLIGAIAFAGSHASLHDGVGQRDWTPTTVPASSYRLAFGQGVLDLRSLPSQSSARTIDITAGAGQIKIIAPTSMNLTVLANVHFGEVQIDGDSVRGDNGVGLSRTVAAPPGATGAPITVDVHLANGQIVVDHR